MFLFVFQWKMAERKSFSCVHSRIIQLIFRRLTLVAIHTHTHNTLLLFGFFSIWLRVSSWCVFLRSFRIDACVFAFLSFFHARLDSTRRGGECVGEAKKHTTSSSLMLIQVGLINTYETGSPLRDGNKAKRAVLKTGRRNRRRTAGRQSVWPVANKTAKVSLSLSLLS